MKSAQQIIDTLLKSIARIYVEPLEWAEIPSSLDLLLRQLHWQYADAIENLDRFADARLEVFLADVSGWQRVHMSAEFHQVTDEPESFAPIIAEWKLLDANLGILLPELPLGPDDDGLAD